MANKSTSATSMAALQSACEQKNFQSFKNLKIGEYYVKKFIRVETQHGKRVQIELATGEYMFLPERYLSTLTDEICADLSKAPKIMTYSGKDPNNGNRLILDFKAVEYFADFFENEY